MPLASAQAVTLLNTPSGTAFYCLSAEHDGRVCPIALQFCHRLSPTKHASNMTQPPSAAAEGDCTGHHCPDWQMNRPSARLCHTHSWLSCLCVAASCVATSSLLTASSCSRAASASFGASPAQCNRQSVSMHYHIARRSCTVLCTAAVLSFD